MQLRGMLLAELPGIIEQPDISANIIGYGYGPGYKDSICTIIPSKKGVKLGFYKGSLLKDPSGLLAGSGKVHKYVDITSEKMINGAALNKLLTQASNMHKERSANNK